MLHGIPAIDDREADALLRAAPLLGDSRPRVVDQDPSHRLRGDREEVGAIVEGDRFGTEQAETQLVDERVGLERVIAALTVQKARGNLLKLGVNDGKKPVAGALIAPTPVTKPLVISCETGG